MCHTTQYGARETHKWSTQRNGSDSLLSETGHSLQIHAHKTRLKTRFVLSHVQASSHTQSSQKWHTSSKQSLSLARGQTLSVLLSLDSQDCPVFSHSTRKTVQFSLTRLARLSSFLSLDTQDCPVFSQIV